MHGKATATVLSA